MQQDISSHLQTPLTSDVWYLIFISHIKLQSPAAGQISISVPDHPVPMLFFHADFYFRTETATPSPSVRMLVCNSS